MSDYKPKVGDRVRIVVEGEATRVTDGCIDSSIGSKYFYINREAIVSIEKIGPTLPTAPGSVVQIEDGTYLALQADGLWCDEPAEKTASYYYKVIFDAGAV